MIRSIIGRRGAALVGVLVLALGTAGCGLGAGPEDWYLDRIEISGHERVATHYGTAIFLGPPAADPLSAVSAPNLTTSPGPASLSTDQWEVLGGGEGRTDDGTDCGVNVKRLRRGADPAFPDWEPSGDQQQKLAAGDLELIRVAVGCPFET